VVTAIVPPRNVLRFIDNPPIGLVFWAYIG
jgi:hypothetical protein